MAIRFPDKLRSNNASAYGIVDATEVSGHRCVASLSGLYALKDCILSRSGDNTENDAIGQVWHVGGSVNKDYRLVSWAERHTSVGWKEVLPVEAIGEATGEASGLMSAGDKLKLDGVDAGANRTEVVQGRGESVTSVMSQAAVTQAADELLKRMQGRSDVSNPYTDPFKYVQFSASDWAEQFNAWLDGLHTDKPEADAQKAGYFRVSLWGMMCEVRNYIINWTTMTFHQVVAGTVGIDGNGNVIGSNDLRCRVV